MSRAADKANGCFWIHQDAIDTLIKYNASPIEICAYLVLAKYTYKCGVRSTVGYKTIANRLGVGEKKAKDVLSKLLTYRIRTDKNIKLVYSISEWSYINNIYDNHDYNNERWVLGVVNSKKTKKIWFDNQLVGNYGYEPRLLDKLMRLDKNGLCIKLLILLHKYTDAYYGYANYDLVYADYCMGDTLSINEYLIVQGIESNLDHFVAQKLIAELSGTTVTNIYSRKYSQKQIFDAIDVLYDKGMLYKTIMVTSCDPDGKPILLYELDRKCCYDQKIGKLDRIADKIESVTKSIGVSSARGKNKFYKKYTAIAHQDFSPNIISIYRPRFLVQDTQNPVVKTALETFQERQENALTWVEQLSLAINDGCEVMIKKPNKTII